MAQFPYLSADNLPTGLMPRLPLLLSHGAHSLEISGLLDTGAAINVLPYSVGIELGLLWENQTTVVPLAGNLANFESRAVIGMASHPQITGDQPVRLVFAWIKSDTMPTILEQVNFFLEFDVCFYRSQSTFDIRLKGVKPL